MERENSLFYSLRYEYLMSRPTLAALLLSKKHSKNGTQYDEPVFFDGSQSADEAISA